MKKNDPLKNKKIFVGFNSAGAAGIYSWTRVLKRRGYKVDFYGRYKIKLNMPVDIFLTYSKNKFVAQIQQAITFIKILWKENYDIWHFNSLNTFFCYPLNLLILKILGKKIVSTFRGSEIRLDLDFLPPEIYQKKDWPEYYQKLVIKRNFFKKLANWSRRIKMRFFVLVSNQIIIIGPFLAGSISYFDRIIPYARTIPNLKISPKNKSKLVIFHAPTNPEIKGTEFIMKVFRNLSRKYPQHQFIISPKVGHDQIQKELQRADIVIDQLLVGWYGGFAVEAMAQGKIAMAFMNPVYFNFMPFANKIPVVNTNIWTLERDLETLLKFPNLRQRLSLESYNFTKKYHSGEKIADQYLKVYREALD